MNKTIRIAQFLLIATLVILGFLAVFVQSVDTSTGIITDGLGRELYKVQGFFTLITVNDYWAGLKWYLIDFTVFWGGVILIFKIDDLMYSFKQ